MKLDDWLFLLYKNTEIRIYSTTLKAFVTTYSDEENENISDPIKGVTDYLLYGNMLVVLSSCAIRYFEIRPWCNQILPR